MTPSAFVAALVTALACSGFAAQSEPFEGIGLKIDTPIAVDGVLSERAWARAVEAGSLISIQPDRRDPGLVSTSLMILFDETFLYLGFECRDREPDALIAGADARDGDIRNDDSVFILLEAADDEEAKFYYFYGTNVLGAALDGRIGRDGQGFDLRWDGTWSNACRRTENGWTAELAIDLRSLRFEAGKDWNLAVDLARVVPRLDRSFWSEPLDPAFRVSEILQMKVLPLVQSEVRGEWGAYALSGIEAGEGGVFSAGLDAERVFSRDLRGRVAVNPDFLTVTPDRERINLTRYELFLPEQRPFFIGAGSPEGEFPSLFYSKRIGDIWGGVRAAGRTGDWEFSGLSAYSKRDTDSGRDREAALYAFGSARRNLGEAGSIAFAAANRLQDGRSSGTAGFEGAFKLGPALNLAGRAALAYGPAGPASFAFLLRPSYDTETTRIHFAFVQIGEEFGEQANGVGFVRDDNRRELRTGFVQRVPIRSRSFSALSFDAQGGIAWGMDGTLRSWDASGGLELELVRKFTFGVRHTRDYKLFEREFRNELTRLDIDFNRSERWQSVGVSVIFGFDLGSRVDVLEFRKRLLFTRNMSLEYDLQRLLIRRGDIFENYKFGQTYVHVVRFRNRFSKVLSLDAYFQAATAIDKRSTQVFFILRPGKLFGTVTFGFLQGTAPFGVRSSQGETLLVKFAPEF